VLVGAALMVAPAASARGWIGDDAARPAVQSVVRALGVRDLILGALTLHVVGREGIGYRTVATCAVADAVDFTATLAVREHLPRAGAAGVLAVAGGSALAGAGLAAALRDS
jgi:hypothetical protein